MAELTVLRCNDAIESRWANQQRLKWSWPDMKLQFKQEGVNNQTSSLTYNDTLVGVWRGLLTPEEVWTEIATIMLDYSVVCEPLAHDHIVLALPTMDETSSDMGYN